MAPHDEPHSAEEQRGETSKILISFLVGSGLLGLLVAGMMSVANNARIAINVAEQHGEEILLVRGEIASLRQEIIDRTKDRFTATDGRYLVQELRRIEQELDEHIKEMGAHE